MNPKGWRLARRVRRLQQTRQADVEERKERIEMFHKHGGIDKTIVRGTVKVVTLVLTLQSGWFWLPVNIAVIMVIHCIYFF